MIRFNYTKVMVILSVLTFSLSVFTSCENEGDFTPHNDLLADSEIRISASVNQLVSTRAENDESTMYYDGETLGLYIRPTSAVSWTHKERTDDGSVANEWYTYPNVKFTKNGVSGWSQNTYAQMLWKGAEETYEYYAYAPYDENAVTNGNKISYYLFEQQGSSESELPDLLRTTKTGTASSLVNEDGKLDILFEHVFCRVKVKITLADEFYQINLDQDKRIVESAIITSSRTQGTVDVFTGEFTSNPEGEDYLPLTISDNSIGSSLLNGSCESLYISYAPGKEKFTVEIRTFEENIDDPTIAGRTFTYTHNEPFDFKSGYKYTINLKMGYDVVQLDAISVSPWKIESEVPGELETE